MTPPGIRILPVVPPPIITTERGTMLPLSVIPPRTKPESISTQFPVTPTPIPPLPPWPTPSLFTWATATPRTTVMSLTATWTKSKSSAPLSPPIRLNFFTIKVKLQSLAPSPPTPQTILRFHLPTPTAPPAKAQLVPPLSPNGPLTKALEPV